MRSLPPFAATAKNQPLDERIDTRGGLNLREPKLSWIASPAASLIDPSGAFSRNINISFI